MKQKVSIFILIALFLSIVLVFGECRGPIVPGSPAITDTPYATLGIGQLTIYPPSTGANGTVGAPSTEEPYRVPAYPSISETGIPYPQPPTQVEGPIETTLPTGYATPSATNTQLVTETPSASQTPVINSPTPTATDTIIPASPSFTPSPTLNPGLIYPGPDMPYYPAYPNPEFTSTIPAYPAPESTATSPVYPGPATSTSKVSQTPFSSMTATATPIGTLLPSPTVTLGTGTPRTTPTELPPRPPLSPPPPGSSVTIWHSWGIEETKALQAIIQSFQRLYPDVTFSLHYIPQDDLFKSFYDAAYLGQGPNLLLGPSPWGPELFDENLISDLEPYIPANFLENINPVALASGEYGDSLISLPLSQHGLLMFRNGSIISTPPLSVDMLISSSQKATHGGKVGSYLDREAYFSAPAIIGLGGQLMDKEGYPAFNDQYGLEWFDLLEAYDVAGAITFNTNWDLEKFKQGRVGLIIDGSWNISTLVEAIGSDNLDIDPWPTYGTGHMSGWVETENMFLNANTTGNDRFAALAFMGYLLDPNVQMRLAEVGHIPSVITTQPRDPHIKQAMVAFLYGVPYPNTTDGTVLGIYRNELDKAIRDVFDRGIDPKSALQTADQNIRQSIDEMKAIP
jgi:ABC-type glycerol-3-phosphate transport system substrate-binding protein